MEFDNFPRSQGQIASTQGTNSGMQLAENLIYVMAFRQRPLLAVTASLEGRPVKIKGLTIIVNLIKI